MRPSILILLFFLGLAAPAWAQGQAFTNRATDLKEQASAGSRTLESLAANTELKVLSRGSGWTKVEVGGKSGWVNVFHLRFAATASTESSGSLLSGLSSVIGGRPKSQQAGIQTVGVRGLTPEELKNASPDGESLKRMQSYAADKGAAERFAREGKLADVKIDYNEATRK
jgi:uncharacterized protein YgiM (DUF1202 family)